MSSHHIIPVGLFGPNLTIKIPEELHRSIHEQIEFTNHTEPITRAEFLGNELLFLHPEAVKIIIETRKEYFKNIGQISQELGELHLEGIKRLYKHEFTRTGKNIGMIDSIGDIDKIKGRNKKDIKNAISFLIEEIGNIMLGTSDKVLDRLQNTDYNFGDFIEETVNISQGTGKGLVIPYKYFGLYHDTRNIFHSEMNGFNRIPREIKLETNGKYIIPPENLINIFGKLGKFFKNIVNERGGGGEFVVESLLEILNRRKVFLGQTTNINILIENINSLRLNQAQTIQEIIESSRERRSGRNWYKKLSEKSCEIKI